MGRAYASRMNAAPEQTHRHDLGSPSAYVYQYDDADPTSTATIPATTYTGSCQALEPWHDPVIVVTEFTVPDGATWVTCPECGEHVCRFRT